jgi:hypothetical protein
MVRQQARDMFNAQNSRDLGDVARDVKADFIGADQALGRGVKAVIPTQAPKFGAPITYTPENQAEGVRRIREIVAKQVRDGK